jgi:cell division transport system ATP-binding protein
MGQPLWGPGSLSPERRLRAMGIIRQTDRLLTDRSVMENVSLPLQIKGLRRSRSKARVRQILNHLGLTARARQSVDLLSATERRLVTLAQVLAKSPPLIVADLNPGQPDCTLLAEELTGAAACGSAVVLLAQDKTGAGRRQQLKEYTHAATA